MCECVCEGGVAFLPNVKDHLNQRCVRRVFARLLAAKVKMARYFFYGPR